jgi:hypothetical protein
MRPGVGEVLHFSEDPHITEFAPHLARTARDPKAYVWAVGAEHAPSYWFPRQCPRAMAWATRMTSDADRKRVLGPHADRVHLIEYAWLSRVRTAEVFAYRFSAVDFRPYGDEHDPHAFVAEDVVRPLGPAEPVGDLLRLHEEAGVELRLTSSLWPWWREVVDSTVGFSGIRLRNAMGAPEPA